MKLGTERKFVYVCSDDTYYKLGIKQHYRSDTMFELKLVVFLFDINCTTNFQIFHIHK